MDEQQFEARATHTLQQIEHALERCGVDVDFELSEGGVLELEFDNGSKIIVNRHGAARELWVAARAGGFHFRWDGAAWRGTRDGMELFAVLSRLVSEQSGTPVLLAP